MIVYGKYECFLMQMFSVCVLCASCGSSQCWILHDLQFLSTSLVPASMVLSPNGLLVYCFLYDL